MIVLSFPEVVAYALVFIGVGVLAHRWLTVPDFRQRVVDRIDWLGWLIDGKDSEPPYEALARIHQRKTDNVRRGHAG